MHCRLRRKAVTNARAESLLDRQGIRYEREPDWIEKGQKPDFYCRGRPNFWCEVKTVGRLPNDEDQNRALAELRNRTSNISSSGYGIAYIRSALSPRDAKAVTNLLKRAVPRLEASDAPDVAVAIIPGDAKRNTFVRFSLSTRDHGSVEFHSCASVSGKYGVPRDMTPEPRDQIIKLRSSSGSEKELSAEDVIKTPEDFRVAVVVRRDDTPFEVIAVMTAGGAKKLDNQGRIRECGKRGERSVQECDLLSDWPLPYDDLSRRFGCPRRGDHQKRAVRKSQIRIPARAPRKGQAHRGQGWSLEQHEEPHDRRRLVCA